MDSNSSLGHDILGSLFGPDVPCTLTTSTGRREKKMLPAALAHALWAIPGVCGVEIMSLVIHHGDWIDDWGQSV